MKTSIQILFALCLLSTTNVLRGQTSKWFAQMGGGYLVLNQLEQSGFKAEQPAFVAYAEIGKTYQPLTIGVQHTFLQKYGFYRYQIKQKIQTIYAKYSLNHLSGWLPYGLDPYIMAGVSSSGHQFLRYGEDAQGSLMLATQEISKRATYTFGGGLQVGSQTLILGLHYQYTAGQEDFTLADFETLPFATGHHLISLNIGIRLISPRIKKRSRCPRFGGKGMIRL